MDREIETRKEEAWESKMAKRQEIMEQISEFKLNNEIMRRRMIESAQKRGAMYRNMIRNNILYSEKFEDSLNDIKRRVEDYTNNKKGSK